MRKELTYIVPSGNSTTLQQVLRGPMGLTCRQVRSAKFRENGILVDGERSRVSRVLTGGEEVRVLLEDSLDPAKIHCPKEDTNALAFSSQRPHLPKEPLPESIILYEDEDLLLVNKPAGICVHPSHGHYGDTLADQVLARYAAMGIGEIPRVVGRLDKDTSGAVLFARNKVAAQRLSHAGTQRQAVHKEYLALAQGNLNMLPEIPPSKETPSLKEAISSATPSICMTRPADHASGSTPVFTISCPIARDPASLNRMIPDPEGRCGGKPACTHLQVLSYDPAFDVSLLRLWLDTGRTHQIRVHMACLGYPLLGDPLYSVPGKIRSHKQSTAQYFHRAALHCLCMELIQPFSGQHLLVQAPLPEDFLQQLSLFRDYPDLFCPRQSPVDSR